MARYTGIKSLTFAGAPVPLAISVKLSKRCEPLPVCGDADALATSVQLGCPVLTAEVRTRQTSFVEGLSLGARGVLAFTVAAADGTGQRRITLDGSVLVGIELAYTQSAVADATLTFAVEAAAAGVDPLTGEEQT